MMLLVRVQTKLDKELTEKIETDYPIAPVQAEHWDVIRDLIAEGHRKSVVTGWDNLLVSDGFFTSPISRLLPDGCMRYIVNGGVR